MNLAPITCPGDAMTPSTSMRMTRLALCGMVLLLAGCSSLIGGKPKNPTTIYAPVARVQTAPEWPSVRWQLALGRALGPRSSDSLRISVRPTPNELQVYKGASWSKPPTDMLEDALLHALEDSGRIAAVARQGSGIGADYRLLLDLRRFESDYAGAATPTATIEITAKLLHVKEQHVVASRTFLQKQPSDGTAVSDVVAAFEHALSAVSRDLAGWTLTTGEAYEQRKR